MKHLDLKNLHLSPEFARDVEINGLISRASFTDINDASHRFYSIAENEFSEDLKNLCFLLGAMTSFHFRPDDQKEPYRPIAVFSDGTRSFSPNDFTDSQILFFSILVPRIENPYIKAIISDIIWIEKRRVPQINLKSMAELAANSFMNLCQDAIDKNEIHLFLDFLFRCVQISSGIRYQFDGSEKIAEIFKIGFAHFLNSDAPGIIFRLIQLGRDFGLQEHKELQIAAEKIAVTCEKSENWDLAVSSWILASQLCENVSRDDATELKRRAAQSFENAARMNIARNSPVLASHFYERSIELYKRIKGTKEKRAELLKELAESQKLMLGQMKPISHSIDISEIASQSVGLVKGKNFLEAILALASIHTPSSSDKIAKNLRKMSSRFIAHRLFGGVVLDQEGKPVYRYAASDDDSADLSNSSFRHRAVQQVNLTQDICARSQIQPAMWQIAMEHNTESERFLSIVQNSPFVPEGREHIFCTAFHRAFEGDVMEACHLLIPQFENSLRFILNSKGIVTSVVSHDMTQEDANLNQILYGEYGENLKNIIGENNVFDMQCLLVERSGTNLRNIIAHGKASVQAMYNGPCWYFIWATLRLTCLPLLPYWTQLEES